MSCFVMIGLKNCVFLFVCFLFEEDQLNQGDLLKNKETNKKIPKTTCFAFDFSSQ